MPEGLVKGSDKKSRCWWCGDDELYQAYHDKEWGRPVTDDQRLFEKICLEGFQAGLSWITILRKRENFRKAFKNFDIKKVSRFSDADIDRLVQDPGIIRHRGKIVSAVNNAQRALELQKEFGSLAAYFWQWEPEAKHRRHNVTQDAVKAMATTERSHAMSKDLKKRGWSFVGPTTMYALMQAMGLVNDHIEGCYCRPEIEKFRKTFKRPL